MALAVSEIEDGIGHESRRAVGRHAGKAAGDHRLRPVGGDAQRETRLPHDRQVGAQGFGVVAERAAIIGTLIAGALGGDAALAIRAPFLRMKTGGEGR